MLTARETAANRYLQTRGMPSNVMGATRHDREQLKAGRLGVLRRALSALQAAHGTPQIVIGEWNDDELANAALDVERRLAAESVAALPPAGGLTNPAGFA